MGYTKNKRASPDSPAEMGATPQRLSRISAIAAPENIGNHRLAVPGYALAALP